MAAGPTQSNSWPSLHVMLWVQQLCWARPTMSGGQDWLFQVFHGRGKRKCPKNCPVEKGKAQQDQLCSSWGPCYSAIWTATAGCTKMWEENITAIVSFHYVQPVSCWDPLSLLLLNSITALSLYLMARTIMLLYQKSFGSCERWEANLEDSFCYVGPVETDVIGR